MSVARVGRYEVERELGAGAMAVVYKAIDPLIGRTVAIKTIKFDSSMGLDQEELRQRLYREAQSAGNLSHPNIVTIYDIGEEGNVAYIAMEFIEGESLQAWMAKNPVPPLQQTLAIIEQIASGLDYAAARGIIHRDIKPANILMTAEMRAKIADFGIAKFSTSKFTQTGAVMGTPAYMSPEQAMGRTLDGRSDIFSLGVIFYEMLTGERPFTGANATTIMYRILHEEPIPPRRLNPSLSVAFDSIIARMLAKDPGQRYQNCAELIQDLRNYQSPGTAAPEIQTNAVPAAVTAPGHRRPLIAALLAVLLTVITVLGYFLYQEYQRTASSSATPGATSLPGSGRGQNAQQPASAAAGEKSGAQALAKGVPAPDKQAGVTQKQLPAAEKPGHAEVRLAFAGDSYPITVYDGNRRLEDLPSDAPSLQVSTGDHRFRVVSNEVYLDQQLGAIRLKADQVYPISIPGLGSAYIEVPNDAYDGCEILVSGMKLATPYPAQVPKLAAGDHRISFRWNTGKYAGKEFSNVFSIEANHHYRVRGEPQTNQVVVQQIK